MNAITNKFLIDSICSEVGITRKNADADYFLNKEELMYILTFVRKLKTDMKVLDEGATRYTIEELRKLLESDRQTQRLSVTA